MLGLKVFDKDIKEIKNNWVFFYISGPYVTLQTSFFWIFGFGFRITRGSSQTAKHAASNFLGLHLDLHGTYLHGLPSMLPQIFESHSFLGLWIFLLGILKYIGLWIGVES